MCDFFLFFSNFFCFGRHSFSDSLFFLSLSLFSLFPLPTTDCERYNGPPNFLPNVGKGYYTPANRADWKLKNGDCRSQADKDAAGCEFFFFFF